MRWARRTGSLSASPLLQRGANEPAGVHLPWECGTRVAARHASAARWQRRRAPPIILFKRLRVGGVAKGFPAFQGFGVIERTELIAQYDARQGCSFPNLRLRHRHFRHVEGLRDLRLTLDQRPT